MAKQLPKIIFAIIFLFTIMVVIYIFFLLPQARKEERIEKTEISWLTEKMGEEEETGAPLMRVRIDFQGKTNQGYDVGTYTGNCFEIAKSKWEFLEQEISGVICGWGGVGDEIGLFKEEGRFLIKRGKVEEGAPQTVDNLAIPNIRGDFKTLLEIKVEGWLPYEFGKTNDTFKNPFVIFYPPHARIVKAKEFRGSGYNPGPPDKLLFAKENKECFMLILPPGFGIEEPPADFSSHKGEVELAGKKWETFIWRVKDAVTFYGFYYKDNDNYSFTVNPENINQCLNTYKQILSTFEFTAETATF